MLAPLPSESPLTGRRNADALFWSTTTGRSKRTTMRSALLNVWEESTSLKTASPVKRGAANGLYENRTESCGDALTVGARRAHARTESVASRAVRLRSNMMILTLRSEIAPAVAGDSPCPRKGAMVARAGRGDACAQADRRR